MNQDIPVTLSNADDQPPKSAGATRKHVLYTSQDCPFDHTLGHSCNVCDGGLAICKVCGEAEASLGEHCPGPKWKGPLPDEVCDICDGGPGNECTCNCGQEAFPSKRALTFVPADPPWINQGQPHHWIALPMGTGQTCKYCGAVPDAATGPSAYLLCPGRNPELPQPEEPLVAADRKFLTFLFVQLMAATARLELEVVGVINYGPEDDFDGDLPDTRLDKYKERIEEVRCIHQMICDHIKAPPALTTDYDLHKERLRDLYQRSSGRGLLRLPLVTVAAFAAKE